MSLWPPHRYPGAPLLAVVPERWIPQGRSNLNQGRCWCFFGGGLANFGYQNEQSYQNWDELNLSYQNWHQTFGFQLSWPGQTLGTKPLTLDCAGDISTILSTFQDSNLRSEDSAKTMLACHFGVWERCRNLWAHEAILSWLRGHSDIPEPGLSWEIAMLCGFASCVCGCVGEGIYIESTGTPEISRSSIPNACEQHGARPVALGCCLLSGGCDLAGERAAGAVVA